MTSKYGKVLVVDLGQTRCKLAMADMRGNSVRILGPLLILPSKEEFYKARRSLDFFIYTVNNIIDEIGTCEAIILAIACPVSESQSPSPPEWWEWGEQNVLEALNRGLKKRLLFVVNDAEAFACGALTLKERSSVMCLTLGGGVGCCSASVSNGRIKTKPLELKDLFVDVPYIGNAHDHGGNEFFRMARHSTDWDRDRIRREYSLRIAAIIKKLNQNHGFEKVIIGGGRSAFLDIPTIEENVPDKSITYQILCDPQVALRGAVRCWINSNLVPIERTARSGRKQVRKIRSQNESLVTESGQKSKTDDPDSSIKPVSNVQEETRKVFSDGIQGALEIIEKLVKDKKKPVSEACREFLNTYVMQGDEGRTPTKLAQNYYQRSKKIRNKEEAARPMHSDDLRKR